MLVVETIAKIRRAYFVHGQPIKAICRELGVSRKVVRKVIRSEATEFRYERETQPLPKMGPWSAELDRLLAANESKAARERLTLIRLFEELRGLGYAGGYDAGFVRLVSATRVGTSRPGADQRVDGTLCDGVRGWRTSYAQALAQFGHSDPHGRKLKEQANVLPLGKERDELMRRARQSEVAARVTVWLASPGSSQPPK